MEILYWIKKLPFPDLAIESIRKNLTLAIDLNGYTVEELKDFIPKLNRNNEILKKRFGRKCNFSNAKRIQVIYLINYLNIIIPHMFKKPNIYQVYCDEKIKDIKLSKELNKAEIIFNTDEVKEIKTNKLTKITEWNNRFKIKNMETFMLIEKFTDKTAVIYIVEKYCLVDKINYRFYKMVLDKWKFIYWYMTEVLSIKLKELPYKYDIYLIYPKRLYFNNNIKYEKKQMYPIEYETCKKIFEKI